MEITADRDSGGGRKRGRLGSERERKGNEMVIRCVQRGYREIRTRAIPYKDQVKEIAGLVCWRRVLQGEVEGVE